MKTHRLTDLSIRNLKPQADRYELPDPGARGLYVVVHPSGKRSFVVRYRHVGVPRKLTLQAGISLAAARKLAADVGSLPCATSCMGLTHSCPREHLPESGVSSWVCYTS